MPPKGNKMIAPVEENENGGDEAETEVTVGGKKKRVKVTQSRYLLDGEETKNPREANGLSITVIGSGTLTIEENDVSPGVANGWKWFGAKLNLTNTLGGKQGHEAFEDMSARWETFAAGEWSNSRGSSGPRIGRLADAIVAALDRAGRPHGGLEAVKAKLIAEGEDYRADALKGTGL